MPTIAFKTRIRTVSDNCILDLVVWHRLVAGEPSAAPRVVKHPPHSVDIVLASPLTITTTGTLDNRRISAEGLMSSRIAQHLPEYLKLNSSELGFEVVSDPHIAKDTGLLSFFCTASRPTCPLEVRLPHLKLLGFDMDYSWHETPTLSSPDGSGLFDSVLTPFSSRLTLPYVTALNNAVERFVRFQMVKRYPRIFGSWIQQLDMEKPFISSMFTSLSNIFRRSSTLAFQESYRTRLKMLEKATSASLTDSENRLSGYLESPGPSNAISFQHPLLEDDETIFIHAMEQTYCLAMKRCKFKVIASPANDFRVLTHQKSISNSQNWLRTAEDIVCDEQQSFVGFEEVPHSEASDEEDLNRCWSISDDRGSISALLSEDLFASDFDPLDALGIGQFLRTTGSSRVSRDVERYDSFPPDLSSILPADLNPDSMFLNVAECLENADILGAKLHTPSSSLDSGLDSSPPTSCTEGYLVSDQVERPASIALTDPSHGFTLSQDISGFKFVTDDRKCADSCGDIHLKGSFFRQAVEGVDLPFLLSDTVSQWDSSVNGVDFVVMEF